MVYMTQLRECSGRFVNTEYDFVIIIEHNLSSEKCNSNENNKYMKMKVTNCCVSARMPFRTFSLVNSDLKKPFQFDCRSRFESNVIPCYY